MNGHQSHVRQPVVAGMFYAENPVTLRSDIEYFLSHASIPNLSERVYGIVVPHAGYVYSGQVAAHAYRLLQKQQFDTAVLIGPSHREYYDGISVYTGRSFLTPLGEVPINERLRNKLLTSTSLVTASVIGHRAEHSLEVQIPFLQVVAPEASILPLVIGNQSEQLSLSLADALAEVCKDENVIFIASSDLSHYHPYEEAKSLDSRVIEYLKKFDPDLWLQEFDRGNLEACGGAPVGIVMKVAKELGAVRTEILTYSNSGDVSGDKSGVVGYVAAAFLGE
ncbi:MAG: AmmeMemoRadiSam system protein B [Bacteroidetes bacterium]|nr:AmmeMemoRadiSam system protein B [Bacteroidota bacterium]